MSRPASPPAPASHPHSPPLASTSQLAPESASPFDGSSYASAAPHDTYASSLSLPPLSMSAGADPWADPAPAAATPGVPSAGASAAATSAANPWATNAAAPQTDVGTLGLEGLELGGYPRFGHDAARFWSFKDGYTNLNSGAYGACPRPVQDAWKALADRQEWNPDIFRNRHLFELLDASCTRLGALLNCSGSDLALVPNSTTATNAVLRDVPLTGDDAVLSYSIGYGAVARTLAYNYDGMRATGRGVPLDAVVPLALPMSEEQIVDATKAKIAEVRAAGKKVKLAIVDTISSMPSACLPWERLVKLFRDEGILSFVDGAHGVGQIAIDIGKADPDFFVSNCHKWMYAHRGCAVFYCAKRNQHLQRSSMPTSWFYISDPTEAKNTWRKQWEATGTIDASSFLSVDAALDFAERLGGWPRIMAYNHALARQGGAAAARVLGTQVLDPEGQHTAAMVNVLLPLTRAALGGDAKAWLGRAGEWVFDTLQNEFKTNVPLSAHNNQIWARFSAQLWLEISDFEWGARCLLAIAKRINTGEVTFPLEGGVVERAPPAVAEAKEPRELAQAEQGAASQATEAAA